MPDYRSFRRLVDETRKTITEISPVEARAKVEEEGAQVIDVRDAEELALNPPLPGAVHMSRGQLEYLIGEAVSRKRSPVVVYCAWGLRGALATASLRSLGYTNVFNVRGGLRAWQEAEGRPWFTMEAVKKWNIANGPGR